MMKLTQEELYKKFGNKYVEVRRTYDYHNEIWMYEILRVYNTIHENTTLGKDIGTPNEYRR